MPIIRLPNGQEVRFPDDMPQEEIRALIANKFPDEVAGRQEPNAQRLNAMSPVERTSQAFRSGATQGMTLGFGDELEAGLFALPEAAINAAQGRGFDLGQGYNQALDRARGLNQQEADLNKVANVAGNVAGNIITASSLPSFSAGAAPTIGSMATRGAADGLVYGAVTGFGTGDDLGERAQQAATGGALGGALGGITGSVAGALANRGLQASTPTAQEIGRAADDAYAGARQSGAVFTEGTTQELVDGMALAARDARINDLTAPQATAMLSRLQQRGGTPMTVSEVEDMRIFLNQLVADGGNEGRVAKSMVRAFDDLMADLRPADFTGGDAELAMTAIKEGRKLFATQQKTRLIEDTIQKAQDMSSANYSASGFENALRQQFKNLLTNRNALNGFSEAEKAAIRQVAAGGPVENILRYVGKLAPTGIVSTGIGVGAGYALGGPIGAGAVLGAGTAARNAATTSTLNNANLARALVAGGGQIQEFSSPVAEALIRSVPAAGGLGGGYGNELVSRALMGR